MRIAILSDIHGNITALEACFKKIDSLKIDRIIWCGDYITDIQKGTEVIQFIKDKEKEYKQYIIRGNREDYILDYWKKENLNWVVGSNEQNLMITYQSLTEEELDWLANLPTELWIEEQGFPKILVSHKKIDDTNADIMISGHTHISESTYKHYTRYINPGSVGFPFIGRPGACFAVLDYDAEHISVEFYHIHYEIEKAIHFIEQSNISGIKSNWDKILIKILLTGEDYIGPYLNRVKQLAVKNNLDEDLDHVPKYLWEQARKELDL